MVGNGITDVSPHLNILFISTVPIAIIALWNLVHAQ